MQILLAFRYFPAVLFSLQALSVVTIEASAQEQCLVADPTGTQLNVRTEPGGAIIGTLANATPVIILENSAYQGKEWVRVQRKDGVPIGWVFKNYLNCDTRGVESKLRSSSSGSGFFVSLDGYIVTNARVVRGCTKIHAKYAYGQRQPPDALLTIVTVDDASDLALYRSPTRPPFVGRIRSGNGPHVGEAVMPLSMESVHRGDHGLDAVPVVSSATVEGLVGPKNNPHTIQFKDVGGREADKTGGPLLGEYGNVVGVVEYRSDALRVAGIPNDAPQNAGFAVDGATLQSFLKANGVSYLLDQTTGAKPNEMDIVDKVELSAPYIVLLQCL
jgi:S1-C subfamily serine protease